MQAIKTGEIEDQLQKFWEIEQLGLENSNEKTKEFTLEERKVYEEMKHCSWYNKYSKRWHTWLLWQEDPSLLGSNLNVADR